MKYEAALVLEGGGMRSAYTQGILDYFIEKDIDFNYIVGVSAGVGCALNFITKQKKRAITLSVDYASDKRVVGLKSFIKHHQFFNLDAIYNILDKEVFFDNEAFKKSSTILKTGCFNLDTGDVDYFDKEDIVDNKDAVIASNSLPLLSKIVTLNNFHYLDGGMRDSIPLNKALNDGNKKIVIILTNPKEYQRQKESTLWLLRIFYRKYPFLIHAMEKRHLVYNDMVKKINVMENNQEIFVIRPTLKLEVTRYSKDKETLMKAYHQGIVDAQERHQQLINYLRDYSYE
ncbi:MAG: patatin family protein [Bacilli bacterium]|jgi:predicted patatin/cPLA2 family phospholipase|nr:patatin family protein [Bacilli bacterium]